MEGLRHSFWPIVLGAAASIFCGSMPAGAVPVVRVQPSLPAPAVGSAFDVGVEIFSVTDLYAYQFEIRFHPGVLAAQGILEGPFLAGRGPTFFIAGRIDNPAGAISPTGNMLLGTFRGVNGSGVLAHLQFQALAPGSSPIDIINMTLLDSSLADISFSLEGGAISAAPEPPILFLLIFSSIFLLPFGKQRLFPT